MDVPFFEAVSTLNKQKMEGNKKKNGGLIIIMFKKYFICYFIFIFVFVLVLVLVHRTFYYNIYGNIFSSNGLYH